MNVCLEGSIKFIFAIKHKGSLNEMRNVELLLEPHIWLTRTSNIETSDKIQDIT